MEKITIYTGGAANGDPGPAGIGVYVVDEKKNVVLEVAESIGNANSEYAAYFAVVRGLQLVAEHYGAKTANLQFELKQSNTLIDQHLKAEAQITNVNLIGHFIEIYNLRVASFPYLTVTLLTDSEDTEAKRLVSELLDAE